MMQQDDFLEVINHVYDDSCYPDGFLAGYSIMECLADKQGHQTFLVLGKDQKPFIAKCFDKSVYSIGEGSNVLRGITHPDVPKQVAVFENETMWISVREYIEGVTLSRYAKENDLDETQITAFCIKLCDILIFLHSREKPIIHRDIKPQNIIVRPDNGISLIDFDIARTYHSENDLDTYFFGTLVYAPPEQYGFSQTDARSDIYSLGVLLRYLLTGNPKPNQNIRIYQPLQKIIDRCTAFSPEERFANAGQVKKALMAANPKKQRLRHTFTGLCIFVFAGAVAFGGFRLYKYMTYTPFTDGIVPAYLSDEEKIREAITFMNEKYATDYFKEPDTYATFGYLRQTLITIYGLDEDYVYGINNDMPQESDAFFLPWNIDNEQLLDRDVAIYAAVKLHDPEIVTDWSSLKDDNGFYPGLRIAVNYAKKTGIADGANSPTNITQGEFTLIFANAEKVFEETD